jgi:hypothetical protein
VDETSVRLRIWFVADVKEYPEESCASQACPEVRSRVRRSVVTPRTGDTHKPKLAANGQMGVTVIGHSSFFLQFGGQNIVIDPNFARWLFVLKRLRRPGLQVRDTHRPGAGQPMPTLTTYTGHRCVQSCSERNAGTGWRTRSWFRVMFSTWFPTLL